MAPFTLYFVSIDQTNPLWQQIFVVVLQACCQPLPAETQRGGSSARGDVLLGPGAAGEAVLRLLFSEASSGLAQPCHFPALPAASPEQQRARLVFSRVEAGGVASE